MAQLDPTLWNEMVEQCELTEDHMVTGALLLLRVKNMETGSVGICIGNTADTDYVIQLGLLEGAKQIVVSGEVDDED
jgi:hypothetical protein